MERPEPPAAPNYRALVIIAAAILALLAGTVAVVLFMGGPRDVELEAGSPEAALQAYLVAHDAGDLEEAHTFFSARVRERWDLDDYRRDVEMYGYPYRGQVPARRVLFDGSDVTGDRAKVRLTVEEFAGEGLSGDVYRWPRDIAMVRENGSWHIDEPLVGLEPAPIDPR